MGPSSSLHSPHTSYKMTPRVIVVGGGLSGLSAAHTIYLAGGNVVVLDKQGFFGGTSPKASSGINGALTRTQVDSKIQDSVKQFYDDTLKSARDKARPDLIEVLTYKSAAAVEWLQDVFNLDLTLVSRLGGHSQPRTHRGHDAKFPGMAITYALMRRLEELAENEPERVQIIKKARVTGLNKDGNKVLGVSYEFGGETDTIEGPVVLATGGYAADFTETSLLKKWRPDTFDLAVSYSSEIKDRGHVETMIGKYPELAIVQDADRLDAIGAVGIGRTFTFGGAKNARDMGETIQHFDDKLVKLESMMKTAPGRRMARERTERLNMFKGWWEDEQREAGGLLRRK